MGWLDEYNHATDIDMEILWHKKLRQVRTSLHINPVFYRLAQLPEEF